MLNKSDLLRALEKEFNFPKKTIKNIVNFVITYIATKVKSGASLRIKGLFTAYSIKSNRSYFNPRTGGIVPAKPRTYVKFKASKSLNS